VGADRAVRLALGVIFNECFHGISLTSSDAECSARVVPKT
jgi:hypothetical protein